MNELKENKSSLNKKEFFRDFFSISSWFQVILVSICLIKFLSILSSSIGWIVGWTNLPEIVIELFRLVIMLPIAIWLGGSVIPSLYRFLESSKLLTSSPINLKLLSLTHFLYSKKIQNEVFTQISADWQEEYFEALFKKEIRKARWINVRYTYAFLAAMWMKSPIGDLIEFVMKIIKIAKP